MEALIPFEPVHLPFAVHGDVQFQTDALVVHYSWEDPRNLFLLNEGALPVRTGELWRSTCFEVFFQPPAGSQYFEINLASSGAWDAYEFQNYRTPQPPRQTHKIQLLKFQKNSPCEIEAHFSFLEKGDQWLCSLATVIELKDKTKFYLASHHAGSRPDFHLQKSLTLRRNRL